MSENVIVEESGVTVVTVGIQGPEGASTGTVLGGYTVELVNLVNNDVLSFSSATSVWKNRPAAELTDGGNF